MTNIKMSADMLSRALLATTALTALAMATPAYAQMVEPAPVRQSIDGNGVDLFDGTMTVTTPALTIGQADQGLSYHRLNRGTGWTDNVVASLNESGGIIMVSLGAVSDRFTVSGTTYTATEGNGATLTFNSGTNIYTYTRADGTIIRFDKVRSGTSPYYANRGRAIDITRPSGAKLTLAYDSLYYCSSAKPGGMGYICTTHANAYRLAAVTNSYGYRLSFSFAEIEPADPEQPEILPDFATWSTVIGVTATNLAVASGASTPSESFAYSTSGGVTSYEVADPLGRITSYRTSGTGVAGITLPGSTSEDVTIAYSGARVSSVTSAADGTTTYAAADASGVRTVTVTDALSHATIYAFDIASRRLNSVTDALGHVTAFQYDGSGRTTRITRPEGNYTQFTYDARGNVTETRLVAKSSSGLAPIVTSATYPSTCTNMATCNQPTTTTDAAGNVTDYVYDSTHGGVVSVTAPAPSTGASRPETRFSYTSLQAYFKNIAGSIVASGQPVYRMTGSSTCQSGTAPTCLTTANERGTSISYGPQATGTGNNLLPVSQTSANGTGTVIASTAMAYDDVGNLLTVDGPLWGSGDTTRFRYNVARERIGTVSPDPDNVGALKPLAQRTTYNSLGQPSAVETGTVNSQSDADWAAMTVLRRSEQDYDAAHRPVVQRLTGGGTTYSLTQTSYDAAGRPTCTAQRMNPAEFATASLPSDACTLDTAGSFGPDRIVRTSYDNVNRPILVETGYGVTGVAANEVVTTYRDNGQPETVTDANGNLTTYVYDGHDRLSRTRMPSPSTTGTSSATDYEELTYATATVGGNSVSTPLVASRRTRDGMVLGFAYDNLNRLTVKTVPDRTGLDAAHERDVYYAYDLLGRLTDARFDSLSGEGVSNSWDALGQIVSTSTSMGGTTRTLSYQYDMNGTRTRITHPDGNFFSYGYDWLGRPQWLFENGANYLELAVYLASGQPEVVLHPNGSGHYFGYDAVQRQSSNVHAFGASTSVTWGFGLNPAGQLSSVWRDNDSYAWGGHYAVARAYTTNGLNQYTAAGAATFGYDGNGNLTGDGTNSYIYDIENRLVGRTNGGVQLLYDPLGRLFQTSSTAGATTQFLYDGNALVAEYVSGTMTRRYVHWVGSDVPVVSYAGSGLSQPSYLHPDHQGSIVAVSDASGVAAVNAYDEYGIPASTNTGRFQYTGQIWLPELGMYHYKARAYSPSLGRFMQTDPIGYADGMNLYAYVSGDPVNRTDPGGTFGLFGGCPAGSRCTSTNPAASNAADGYLNAKRESEIENALPGISRAGVSQIMSCMDNPTPVCMNAQIAGWTGGSLEFQNASLPFFALPDGSPIAALSDARFYKIRTVHTLPVNPAHNKSYFFSFVTLDKDIFSAIIIVPALSNPNLTLTNRGSHVEIRSTVPGPAIGIDIFGRQTNVVVIRGVGGRIGGHNALIISNAFPGY